MLNRMFFYTFINIAIYFFLFGCLPLIQTVQAPTIPYDGPYVIVEPKIGYPESILDESGFKFPAGEIVTIDFIDPNGQIAVFHESHPKTYVTDIDGKFTYYYTVRQEEMSGLWTYYASYGNGENLKHTPSVSFWITNPSISVISGENNHIATLNGVGFTPGGKAQITVDYISPYDVIEKTEVYEVSVDKTGKFYKCCKAEQGTPLLLVGNNIKYVRFSAIDLTTGYPTNSDNKIEALHSFSDKVLGAEVVINQDTIIGFWHSDIINGGTFEVRQDQDNLGCYVMVIASDEYSTAYRGEVTGKVCYNQNEKSYIGKHVWGGSKSDTTFWGEDNGMIITIVNSDTLFMRFVDSKYTGGWTLTRLR